MGHAALLFILLSTATAITDARQHLEQHKLDDVLFDLTGKKFDGADVHDAAAVLGKAASESRADPLLSLQFAQLALKLEPQQPEALEACARAAFSQKQFDLAEPCADRWVTASHKGGPARLLRAQIALDEGDWTLAKKLAPDSRDVPEADRAAADEVRAQSRKELVERAEGLSVARGLDRALKAAMEKAGNTAGSEPRRVEATPASSRDTVVVYGTSWCVYCRRARDWFRTHKVPFEDKDVEKDPEAVKELAQKAEAAHMEPQGVPIIDVHGTLISGFDLPRIKEALR